jgi:peroxin-5
MWDAPLAQHPVMAAPAPQSQSSAEGAQRARPDDDLARTAGILLESVAHDTRAKFQQSAFLGLMRQLRDGDVVVDGDRMVPRSEAADADVKGKGKARAAPSATMGGLRGWTATANADTSAAQADGAEDAYWRQENAEYSEYWRGMARGAARVRFGGAQDAEWGHLQDDWDAFEATAAGVRPVARYQFQAHNPYVRGGPSTATRQHALHAGGHGATYDVRPCGRSGAAAALTVRQNVLQMEAAVQRAPGSADAWCALGVRQQEAEREQKAIQALERALALDPAHQAARLGLAVSLTNEGNRAGAVAALHAWVTRHARFGAARTRPTDDEGVPRTERATALVNCLLEMARAAPEGEVDADMQIAMAVLLNTNEVGAGRAARGGRGR